MRIVLIGPFPPYRGGISMFNHSLSNQLAKDNDITRISFSRQYPNFLFPGKSEYDDFKDNGSLRIIDSLNPFSWKSSANEIIKKQPSLIIFQIWNPFFAFCFSAIIKNIKKKCNAKIIFICNNILPHERFIGDYFLTKKLFKLADGFIVMSNDNEKLLAKIINEPKYLKLNHPNYDIFGKALSKETAKTALGISRKRVILHFGLIRPYKGLDLLLNSIPLINDKVDDFIVLIAGESYEDSSQYKKIIEELDISNLVRMKLKFIPKNKVALYFSASDLVVLPYKSATQSGIIPIAYQFNKPVIVTNVGGLPEVVLDGKTGFICNPTKESIAKNIIKFYSKGFKEFSKNINKHKKYYNWEFFTKELMKLVIKND